MATLPILMVTVHARARAALSILRTSPRQSTGSRALVRKRPLVLQSLDVNELATDTLRFVGGDARRRHVTLPAKFATAEHQRHAPETVGCVDCLMPERTYMVIDDRRDHSFRIPRPASLFHLEPDEEQRIIPDSVFKKAQERIRDV